MEHPRALMKYVFEIIYVAYNLYLLCLGPRLWVISGQFQYNHRFMSDNIDFLCTDTLFKLLSSRFDLVVAFMNFRILVT